jgi:hypothetical protein
MILGMSTAAFTEFHVILSLIGIASGVIAVLAMLWDKPVPTWTALFLLTTIATSATGFLFHTKFGPPHVIGLISLVILAVAVLALYRFKLAGSWRWIYVVSAVAALYFNVFVAVVQSFQKIGFFHALAPTQTEPPFAIAQGVVLLAFIAIGVFAVRRFRRTPQIGKLRSIA